MAQIRLPSGAVAPGTLLGDFWERGFFNDITSFFSFATKVNRQRSLVFLFSLHKISKLNVEQEAKNISV